ncbi:uncharacterized protein SCHCODRAFT_02629081 [Schizophyllum commune H4-8]|uniref:uncharacterized protein n=1 Tax=Schizophyllum commune (strain H4-8 / FGSC 9210) TaxID=578458 RepID=UPI002160D43B|nr:uncharacterized protein SCHCODRAFT_02629081 [Schizophyllum commune H4-8]KAI5891432.1 hypothetical protein SCHCODRAFT_02629081 [Schizophyllum commune H4-8]
MYGKLGLPPQLWPSSTSCSDASSRGGLGDALLVGPSDRAQKALASRPSMQRRGRA